MAVLVIGNTYSGGGRGHQRVAEIARQLGADTELARWSGHAQELAANLASGYEVVVAAGGDGTVHEVVNGLMAVPSDQRPALGLAPLGTGNDIARNLGLTQPHQAVEAITAGHTQGLDLFRVECHDEYGRPKLVWGVLNCGIGYGAEVVRRTSQRMKRVAGPALAYLWGTLSTLATWDSPSMTLTGDFGRRRGRAFFVSMCNGEWECGASLRIAPGALMTDGVSHLVVVRHAPRPMLALRLPLLGSGRHIHLPQVTYVETNTLGVACERPVGLQSDGDVVGYTPCAVRLVPAALRVLAP